MTQINKVTSNLFNEIECDFFTNESGDIIMTAEQIGCALGYADGRKAVNNLFNRNRVRLEKFSDVLKTRATDGKMYDTLIFNEQGIYALIFLSNKQKAIEFQEWVYERIKEIRRQNVSIVTTENEPPELLKKVRELENKIESYITLTSYEASVLQKTINKRVCEIEQDKEKRGELFRELHREIRDRFGVPSYRDVARTQFQSAISYVKAWIPRAKAA